MTSYVVYDDSNNNVKAVFYSTMVNKKVPNNLYSITTKLQNSISKNFKQFGLEEFYLQNANYVFLQRVFQDNIYLAVNITFHEPLAIRSDRLDELFGCVTSDMDVYFVEVYQKTIYIMSENIMSLDSMARDPVSWNAVEGVTYAPASALIVLQNKQFCKHEESITGKSVTPLSEYINFLILLSLFQSRQK